MEKALLLSPSKAETISPGKLAGYSTLIIGSEFCQNQIPSPGTLRNLRRGFRGRVGIATSIMTDSGLAEWEKLLRVSDRHELISEVVVNDWGFIPLAAEARLPISVGRLLVRELVKLEHSWTLAFIKKYGIVSAETDTPELTVLSGERLGLKISFHPCSVFKAVTSYCPFEKHFSFDCGRTCEKKAIRLTSRELNFSLLLSEKAYFTPEPGRAAPRGVWRTCRTPLPGRNRAGSFYI